MSQFPFTVLQIVGYKNSGKTSVMTSLIHALQKEGLWVGTVKHHGHGGEPDKVDHGTDSTQHFDAGAVVSGVEGGGVFQWKVRQNSWTLDALLDLYRPLELDIVLVEGYKADQYPKWVLLRDEKDHNLLNKVENIRGIVYNGTCPQESVPSIPWDEESTYIQVMLQQIKGDIDGT